MFNVYVRPKVEYASQVWNPSYLMDIDKLEQVQRRFTKRLPGLSNFSYSERLRLLKIDSLECRRIRADLIFVYKLLHNLIDINYTNFFELKTSRTRGHRLSLVKPNFKKDVFKHSFAVRVVDWWNSLPENIANAPSLPIFRRLISTHDMTKFIKGRGLDVRK